MENDETVIQDEQQMEEEVVVEETTTEEAVEQPKPEGVTLTPAEFRHYKKWKDAQAQPQPKPQPQAPQQSLSAEEAALLVNGMPKELLKELKVIAQVRGTGLIETQNDPVFLGIKDNFDKTKKQNEASLPASRGSGNVKPKKDFNTPGLSREEHIELLKKQGLM